MSERTIEEYFGDMAAKKVCVIGDFILDYYRMLVAKSLSPESPTVIFHPKHEEYRAGGAGNVVANLEALGIDAALVTVLGAGAPVELPTGCIHHEFGRKTTIKERLVTARQQVLRIDDQSHVPITDESADFLVKGARDFILEADAIIFSDYSHGVCVPKLIRPCLELAVNNGIPVVVDSKASDTISKYCGCTIAVPNLDEARAMTRLDEFEENDIAKYLLRHMVAEAVAITLGPRGILLCTPDKTEHFPILNEKVDEEIVDVTGAGDTVAAVCAAGLCVGMPYDRIIKLANVAAGVKVQKRGVATASPSEILAAALAHSVTI